MVSMKDIANRLNLSRCTVSNILNNRFDGKSYRKETIEMVLSTAKEMGYVSNSMARALKTGSTGTIAIVVPDIANPFYINIIKEVERRAIDNGYSLIICMAEEILKKENAALTMLQSRCVDGVLISPVSYTRSLQQEYPFKVVCFDRVVEGDRYNYVRIDNYTESRRLAEAMIADGAKKPLFLAGSREDYTVVRRYRGFCDVMHEHGLKVHKSAFMDGLYDEQSAYESMNRVISNDADFDSVILSTDYLVYGVLRAIREHRRENVILGGFERFSGMDLFADGMHVLEQPEVEMGRESFDMLHRLIKGEAVSSLVLPAILL